MENDQVPQFNVSDFIAIVNQSLDIAFSTVEVVGEVSSFKINQGKYVFFDLKDQEGVLSCFMMQFQLRVPLEDGMKVVARVAPKLTKWGKFSLTVQAVRPVGEGSIKKSFELLKKKLDAEGLFSEERKRVLPNMPSHIAVISSTQSAGYADFIKILNDRWGGLRVETAHVQVQGESAPDQIIRAIKYFNSQEQLPEVLVIIRGGGSIEDLSVFNDEKLIREIAASRVPTLVGVGHETDETLADMVADVRAATPSNAAQIVVPGKIQVLQSLNHKVQGISVRVVGVIDDMKDDLYLALDNALNKMDERLDDQLDELTTLERVLQSVNPEAVLERGYALVRGEIVTGGMIEVETKFNKVIAEVKEYYEK